MTPLEMHQRTRDTGALSDLFADKSRAAAVCGAVGSLLLLVNAKDPLLRTAAGALLVGSLYYGIAMKPAEPEISSNP